jgi:acyl-CoA reductase-like NAD-dependent aldehyde dehydrogenase
VIDSNLNGAYHAARSCRRAREDTRVDPGMKQSGPGREGGREGLRAFRETRFLSVVASQA